MSKLPSIVLRRGTDPELAEFVEELITLWNTGRYQISILSAAPTHTGEEGEMYAVDEGGTQSLYIWVGGAWRSVTLT